MALYEQSYHVSWCDSPTEAFLPLGNVAKKHVSLHRNAIDRATSLRSSQENTKIPCIYS